MPIFKLNIWPQPALSSIFSIPVKHHSPKCVWAPRKEGVKSPFLHPSGTSIAGPFQPVSILGINTKTCLLSYSSCPSLSLLVHSMLFSYLALYHWGLPSENSVSEAPLPIGFCFSLIRVSGTCGNRRPRGGGGPGYSQPHSDPNIPGLSDVRVLLILWIGFFFTISTRQVPILFRPSSNINSFLASYISILYRHQVTCPEHF